MCAIGAHFQLLTWAYDEMKQVYKILNRKIAVKV